MSEIYKDLIDVNDNRFTDIIKENDILYILIHGLRDNLLIGDFYLSKNEKKSLNSEIIENMNRDFYQNIYRNSFKIKNDAKKKYEKKCNRQNTFIYPKLDEINTILPLPVANNLVEENVEKNEIKTDKNKFNTQKKRPLNFLDELKQKQQRIV